jgi:hypothetical protein
MFGLDPKPANLRDVLARVTAVLEAIADGDMAFVEMVLGDLQRDLGLAIEAEERSDAV